MDSRTRFLNASRGAEVDRPPVWIMRQAGRTLPEYMALREQHSFLELMGTPELAAEVTLQPLRRFPLDAAIIFSDILVIPAALGQEVGFEGGLSLTPAIGGPADFAQLEARPVAEKLAHVLAALKLVRAELGDTKALLGFAGAPFTVASYMVEGGSSKSYARLKSLMYREPEFFRELLFTVADATVEYLKLQSAAGADAVQLFDSWAGELSPEDYREFALPAARRVAEGIRGSGVPLIYFINGIGNVLEPAAEIGADIIGVDWRISLPEVRRRLGADTVVQGNLDPGILFAPPEVITRRTHAMLDSTGGRGHIANLGHGLKPGIPLAGIGAFIDAVISWRGGQT